MYVPPSTYQYNRQHMIGGGNYWGGAYYSPSNSGKYPGFLAHHPQSAQWMAHNAWREGHLPGPGQAGYSGPSYTDEFGNLIQGTAAGFTAPTSNPLGGLGGLVGSAGSKPWGLGSSRSDKPWTYKDSVSLLGGLSLGGRGL